MDRPFIYIASLQRTGSTVLSEALTLPPHSFIFREPLLGIGRFELRGGGEDALTFMNYGIDLLGFKSRWTPSVGRSLIGRLRRKWSLYKRRSFVLEAFKNELVPQFASCLTQIGVKEIKHEGWRGYLANFPEMRVILTGRDPRDIFTSLYYRWKGGKYYHPGKFTPESVAKKVLLPEFRRQLEMYQELECMLVKYEDLCTNKDIYKQIKVFTDSTIPEIGMVGSFNRTNPRRVEEYELHGDVITQKRVNRWQSESDRELVSAAQRAFNLMPAYCEFWGYQE